MSVEDDELAAYEITSGGGDLDGVALIGPDGSVVDTNDNANTGASGTLDADEFSDWEGGSAEFTVYGYSGNTPDDSIDDADANVNLGTVELDEDTS